MIHIYYFPEIDEFRFVYEECFCDDCPHKRIAMWFPETENFYTAFFIGEL